MIANATTRAEYEAAFEKLKSLPIVGEHHIGEIVIICSLRQWSMRDEHSNCYGSRTGSATRMREGIRIACNKWLNTKFR
jgi:hypothetical protein